MAFDGLFIHSLLTDLSATLTGAKLSKIYQPFAQDLILVFRKERQNKQLLISTNAQNPRMYLTNLSPSNPVKAPTFVMVLRKYLEGAILQKVEQVGLARIVNFYFSSRNELGDNVSLVLSVELMGRHSNVILYDQVTQKIIDLLRRVNPDENRARLLLPKAPYELPPLNPGVNGLTLTESEFLQLKTKYPAFEDFVSQFDGLDRDDRMELAGYLEDDFSYSSLRAFFQHFEKAKGYLFQTARHQDRIFPYLPYHLELTKVGEKADFNQALDDFYQDLANREWVKQRSKEVRLVTANESNKLAKKLVKLQKQLEQAEHSEEYQIKGQILNAYLHEVKPGMTKVMLPNWYDNNEPLEIRLDPALSPAKNAQKYFQRYAKMRNSIKHVTEQIKLTKENIAYFDGVQTLIDNADPDDIEQIKDELIAQGYIKQKQVRKKKKLTEQAVQHFTLSTGRAVLVGKNNYQNDWLTFKKANKHDFWFHVKNLPGSHVILQTASPSELEIKETAEIAAYYSKARQSAHVQVDYVQVKAVKKPNGAKPGFVIYTGQNSIEVTPDEEVILSKKSRS